MLYLAVYFTKPTCYAIFFFYIYFPHFYQASPACLMPRIDNSFSFKPNPLKCSLLPLKLSIALIPAPPSISFISRDQAVSRFKSFLVPISGLSLFVRYGSWVAMPQLHLLV